MTNLSYLCNDNKFFSKVYCTHVFWFLSYSGNFLFGFFLLGCFPSFSFSETYFDQYFQRFQWYLILFIFNLLTFSDLHFFHFSKKKKKKKKHAMWFSQWPSLLIIIIIIIITLNTMITNTQQSLWNRFYLYVSQTEQRLREACKGVRVLRDYLVWL